MSLLTFLPLVLALAICLIPVWLLRQSEPGRAQDFFVASQRTRPEVARNSSIAYALRMVAFGPLFVWGASGSLWPAIIVSVSFGLGVYLIYIVREPLLEFLDDALKGDRSITTHEFIALRHGSDRRVRVLAASLTLLSLLGLFSCEVVALGAFLKPMLLGNAAIYLLALGALSVIVWSSVLSGHSGILHSTQLQLGMLYLGLFGSTVLLLYRHLSARTPMPPHGALAVAFVAVFSTIVLVYRRSKYVDTDRIRTEASGGGAGGESACAGVLSRFGKTLNICLSFLLVLIIIVALMEVHAAGWRAILRDSAAALRAGPELAGIELTALVVLPLFYPLADVTNWLKLAATRRDVSGVEPGRRSAALRSFFWVYAAETCLMGLFTCAFGAIAATAVGAQNGTNVLRAVFAVFLPADNGMSVAALSLLLIALIAAALSTMSALFSAILCTIRYDLQDVLWPEFTLETPRSMEGAARRRALIAGTGLCLVFVAALCVADALLQVSFTSDTFLALSLALCCAQLSLVALVAGPMLGATRNGAAAVNPAWALVVVGFGAAGGVAAAVVYVATRVAAWLWSAPLVCLGLGAALFFIGRAAAPRSA